MTLSDERPRLAATLVERQAARVDRLRGRYARLGAVPHRVFIRLYRWDGGARHQGERELIQELELTPPPELRGAGSQTYQVNTGGTRAEGTVQLVGISPRYTESDLDPLVRPRTAAEEVEVHLVPDGREGGDPQTKRYRPVSKPERDVLGFQWTLFLELLDDKRASARNAGDL